jgi:hypothetical protein
LLVLAIALVVVACALHGGVRWLAGAGAIALIVAALARVWGGLPKNSQPDEQTDAVGAGRDAAAATEPALNGSDNGPDDATDVSVGLHVMSDVLIVKRDLVGRKMLERVAGSGAQRAEC